MPLIHELIDNSLPQLDGMAQYAAILGESPSKGARSPLLWNAAFDDFGIECTMLPMDISVDNLEAAMETLEKDERFIGGAIAVPHKETIASWLLAKGEDRLSPEAKAIGAVNCLYRDSSGVLCATNTDGEGALASLKDSCNQLENTNILLIGLGGAGKAVAGFVGNALGKEGKLSLSVRQTAKLESYAASAGAKLTSWPPKKSDLEGVDILINCSTIGFDTQSQEDGLQVNLLDFSPLAKLDDKNHQYTREKLSLLSGKAIVFDVIYDPSPTKLLSLADELGLATLDGSMMNLEQAVIAFKYATEIDDVVQIREVMGKVASKA